MNITSFLTEKWFRDRFYSGEVDYLPDFNQLGGYRDRYVEQLMALLFLSRRGIFEKFDLRWLDPAYDERDEYADDAEDRENLANWKEKNIIFIKDGQSITSAKNYHTETVTYLIKPFNMYITCSWEQSKQYRQPFSIEIYESMPVHRVIVEYKRKPV